MRIFGYSHAWRALLLAWGMAWFGPAADLTAGTPDTAGANVSAAPSAEPFGLFITRPSEGRFSEKWHGVERALLDEMQTIALCEKDRANCPSAAALQFLAIVDQGKAREGRARLGEINRAINLAIRSMTDLAQYGVNDVWSSPLATLTAGAGDCEDYAIAKLVALRLAGVSDDDLRLVILHDTKSGEGHAVVAARLDGRWLMLDNRRMVMLEDAQVRNYRPTFVIDRDGVRSYDEPQLVALGQGDAVSEAADRTEITMSPM